MLVNFSLWLEVRRWRQAGRKARLWWRDDDAARGSAALDRLLQVSRATAVPVTLAVVPAGDLTGLGRRIARTPLVSVSQHGFDQQLRRSGPVSLECPRDLTQAELEISLRRGWNLIQNLPRAAPVFVPPWNDAHPMLEGALAACGYAGWSANGELAPRAKLPRIDAHIDLLCWAGRARFRGRGRFLSALTAELRRRRETGQWDAPIGLLTHHLDHDDQAWEFLDTFLCWTRRTAELDWVSLPELIREAA